MTEKRNVPETAPERAMVDGPVVLVIEDEPPIRRFLRPTLANQGYRIVEAETGEDGLLQAATRQPDLVILDLGLPDLDGLEVIRRLREWTAVPIIVLSARGADSDKVAALDAGADDYVAKPFAIGELLARAALRHAASAGGERNEFTFTSGDLRVDLLRRRVFVGAAEVRLTPTEYRLLAVLVQHAGKVLQGADAPPAPPGSVGPRPRRADPLPARVHGQPAAEARAGSRPAPHPPDRAGRRLPAALGRRDVRLEERGTRGRG
jgi:two-component system KDP operon response regulator KdpE